MEIQKHLLRFRYQIGVAVLVCVAVFSALHLAPRFLNVLAYFWPLFLSTALFLALVLFFAKTQTLSHSDDAALLKPAEDLLHFVAGNHHDPPLDTRNKSD